MLQTKTFEPNTLSVLKKLQSLPELNEFYLVGGTALALKYGHRLSVDLDLFGEIFNKEQILSALQNAFGTSFKYEETNSDWSIFCFIDDIKVDIVKYPHPLISPISQVDGLKIIGTEDIATMKINAILGGASKKDFFDLFELLQHFPLEEIIMFYKKKYPNQMLLISIPQAVCYFDDAESSESPESLTNTTWECVKETINKSVREYLS